MRLIPLRKSTQLTMLSILATGFITLSGCQSMSSDNATNNSPSIVTDANTAKVDRQITPSDLASHNWTLVTATDGNNQPITVLTNLEKTGKPAILDFTKDNISPNVGCNSMSSSYTIENNVLMVSDAMQSTMMLCAPLKEAERKLANLVVGTSQLELKDGDIPVLTQITEDGSTLVWQGAMTYAARYGKPTTVFWEVNPSLEPCPDGTTKTCLQVRPVTYSDNGVKASTGQWVMFDGKIDGYTHDEKHRQILRLSRYTVDADSQEYAYVLDTVVESELIK